MRIEYRVSQTFSKTDYVLEDEGVMALPDLKEFVGDANFKVTLGKTQKNLNYGNGGETFLSFSASCNQDDKTISMVVEILDQLIDKHLSTLHSGGLVKWKENEDLNKGILANG